MTTPPTAPTTQTHPDDTLRRLRAEMYQAQTFPPTGMSDAEREYVERHNETMAKLADLCNYYLRRETK